MSYVQGFVLPVPADKKEAYRKAAADFSPIARNSARPARSRPGATTYRTASSPTSRAP